MISALTVTMMLSMSSPQVTPVADVCEKACVKVTRKTARHWPKKRRNKKDTKDAYERMKKQVHNSCMNHCKKVGKPFAKCVRRAKDIKKISRCYLLPPKK